MPGQEEVARIQEQIKTLFSGQERIEQRMEKDEENHGKEVNDIYREIKALKEQFADRLPTWATVVLSILTAALGACLGWLCH